MDHNKTIKVIETSKGHINAVISLLGIVELCKVTGSRNLYDLVNRYQVPVLQLSPHVGEVWEQDNVKNLLDHELKQWVEDIVSFRNHCAEESKKLKGSGQYFGLFDYYELDKDYNDSENME